MQSKKVSIEWEVGDTETLISFNGFVESNIDPIMTLGLIEIAKFEILNMKEFVVAKNDSKVHSTS